MKYLITVILSSLIFICNLNQIKYQQEQKEKTIIEYEMVEGWKDSDYKEYQKLEEEEWETKRNEYPEATYIWEYLKNYGYNDYVCAGILGNIMVEVGGHTLAIQPDLCSNGYAGMCQWALKYRPEAAGLSLEEQCIFLTDTIEDQFVIFAWIYQKGFSYEDFKGMTNCEDAALAFAKVYERCGSGSYSLRQKCALTAYNYFVEE